MLAGYVASPATVALSATAKTVINLIAGANEYVAAVCGIHVCTDGTQLCLVELCESTQAGAGTSTDFTASLKQVRGFAAGDSTAPTQLTCRTAYSAEPTVLTRLYAWRFTGPGPLVLQWPLAREPQSLLSGSTKYKGIALRVSVASGTPNCDATIDFEIG